MQASRCRLKLQDILGTGEKAISHTAGIGRFGRPIGGQFGAQFGSRFGTGVLPMQINEGR
jgi:hypothetical protein